MTNLWARSCYYRLPFQPCLRSSPTNPRRPILAPPPQQKQLDFWVGEWDLTWPGTKAGETGHGTNSIKRIMDGCVVQENFSGLAQHLRGTSVSIFDAAAGKWKQTWVDNQGGYLDFIGEFKDGQMILQREATGPNGTKFLQRMVWKNITRQRIRLELGIVPRRRQDLAGEVAHPLQDASADSSRRPQITSVIDGNPRSLRKHLSCSRVNIN